MNILATLDIQSLLFLLVPYKQEAVQYSKVNSKWPKQSENSNPRITDT